MPNVIRFKDGVMVEVAASQTPGQPVSGSGKTVERVGQAFQSATGVAGTALKSIVTGMRTALQDTSISEAVVEFGVGFSIEGDIYITKVKGEANINVTVTINARPQ